VTQKPGVGVHRGLILARCHQKQKTITGGSKMLLTKKELKKILQDWRVSVPVVELEKKLLDDYGNPVTDDEGHLHDYTEQDIYEQLRKKLLPYAKNP
jgi:hypothetical protein